MHQLLYDGANRQPGKTALNWVDRDRSLSYEEAASGMDRVAGGLASLRVGRGDRVGIFAHNGLDYVLAMFGAWRIGAIAALISVQYADELDYFVRDAEPRVLIYTGDHQATMERHRGSLPSVEHFVCLDGPMDGAIDWRDLLDSTSPLPSTVPDETDVAHLSYTSGTTGSPKGACLAHEPTLRATRCIAERLRIATEDISLGPTSLSSSYHLVANLLPTLHRTGTVGIMSRWDQDHGWEVANDVGATILAANPPILTQLLAASRSRKAAPRQLRVGLSGGAPVPPDLKRAWREELGIPLAESYGQSELGGFVALSFPDLDRIPDHLLDAVGPPLPDKEVRIFDADGNEARTASEGEIVLRGGFMSGYWRRPESTEATLRDGWLHTGDVGFMDAHGYLHFRGRMSERVRVGEEYWYPRDVEEALLRHPAVTQAALIGVPDGAGAERPVACVTVSTRQADPGSLVSFADDQLGRGAQSFDVVIVAGMPMTPTGKISKAQLREALIERGAR